MRSPPEPGGQRYQAVCLGQGPNPRPRDPAFPIRQFCCCSPRPLYSLSSTLSSSRAIRKSSSTRDLPPLCRQYLDPVIQVPPIFPNSFLLLSAPTQSEAAAAMALESRFPPVVTWSPIVEGLVNNMRHTGRIQSRNGATGISIS